MGGLQRLNQNTLRPPGEESVCLLETSDYSLLDLDLDAEMERQEKQKKLQEPHTQGPMSHSKEVGPKDHGECRWAPGRGGT